MKRTALKRRKPLSKLAKAKRRCNSTYWRKLADAEFRRVILERAGLRCAICNTDWRIEVHHLISRAIPSTRHDLENGMALCSLHHKWDRYCSPHGGAAGFFVWLAENRPKSWAWLDDRRLNWGVKEKHDYRAAYERLKTM